MDRTADDLHADRSMALARLLLRGIELHACSFVRVSAPLVPEGYNGAASRSTSSTSTPKATSNSVPFRRLTLRKKT